MRRLGRAGFTLTELMVSLGLLGVILASVMGVVINMQRGYVRQREVARAEDALRVAEATIMTILRTAEANPLNIKVGNIPRIEVVKFDSIRVLSDFNPPNGNLAGDLEDVTIFVRNDTLYTSWRALLPPVQVAFPVRSLWFDYFPAAGTVPLTVAQIPAQARRVRFILTAPRHSKTTALARRETWVYLRNRR